MSMKITLFKKQWQTFKDARYKFWQPRSGMFGGITMGLLLAFIVIIILVI